MTALIFSLSVDDGHPLDFRIADMLKRHGLPASFYVPIHNSEGAPVMTASQTHELARYFDVGSHTMDHRYLTSLNDEVAWRQIIEGKSELEQRIGRQVSGFCYPGGKYRVRHLQMVGRAGFRYARTTRNLYPSAGHEPLAIPTSLQFYPHERSVLVRNFVSQGSYASRWPAFRAIVMEDNWLMRLYRLFDHLEQHGSVFHLWCHAADIEHLQLWKALDHFLGFVARRIPAGRRLDNGSLIDGQLRDVALVLPDHQKIM